MMQQTPLVSIISVYFNRENWIEHTLQSILQQTYKNYEFIIIDDCSTDNTYKRLKDFEKKDTRIKVIRHETNKGFVTVLRDAIDISTSEYIAIQGSGDISLPTRIEKQAEILNTRPDIGLVGCLRGVVNKTELTGLFEYKHNEWIEGKSFDGNAAQIILNKNLFAHGSVMYRKDLYTKIGGYRKIFSYAQDRDLWIRFSEHCNFYVIDEVLYERYFLTDAISVYPEKLLVQRYLSELAVQCALQRRNGEKDIVDSFGVHASFFMKPSKKLSEDLAKTAIKWLNQGNKNTAYIFAKAALEQHRNFNSLFTWFLVNKVPFGVNKKINKAIFFYYRIKKGVSHKAMEA